MSIYVEPNTTFECQIETGLPGLTGTIGLLIQKVPGDPNIIIDPCSTVDILETPVASGVYIATRTAPLEAGFYSIVWENGCGGQTLGVEDLFVQPAGAPQPLPSIPDSFPFGPAAAWIQGSDVVAGCAPASGQEAAALDEFAWEASAALYEISGRLFAGVQQRKVRPCRDGCRCWGSRSLGLDSPWFWVSSAAGTAGWYWQNDRGELCGCNPLNRIPLAGYPVREILEVKIDGVALPEFDLLTGLRNWRLDYKRELVRMASGSAPYSQEAWPGCQNLDLDDTQPGTFSILYTWGAGPPRTGVKAAIQLACQLWLALNGQACQLPVGAVEVVREGVRVQRGVLANFLDRSQPTGLIHLDTFLRAYSLDGKLRRRGAVLSPDIQQYPRRDDTSTGS